MATPKKIVQVKPPRGTYVSRAAFAKLQGEKNRLLQDVYTMVMGNTFKSIEVRMKWKKRFEDNMALVNAIREMLNKEKNPETSVATDAK